MHSFGKHYLVEYLNCDPELIGQADQVEKLLLEAVEKSDATYVGHEVFQFQPHGASCIVLISQSHMSIHTWPDYQYAAVDIFTCADNLNVGKAIDLIQEKLKASEKVIKAYDRGF